MILWTVQDECVLRSLDACGCHHAAWDDNPFTAGLDYGDPFRQALVWMAGQMRRRLGPPPADVQLPIWAWEETGAGQLDLERWAGRQLERPVALRLEMAEDATVASSFEAFHYPLNFWYLPGSMEDQVSFDRWRACLGFSFEEPADRSFGSPGVELVRWRIIESWSRIFQPASLDPCIFGPPEDQVVQHTFWELEVRRITAVERLPRRRYAASA